MKSSEGVDESAAVLADPVTSWSLSAAFWIWLLSCADRLRTWLGLGLGLEFGLGLGFELGLGLGLGQG